MQFKTIYVNDDDASIRMGTYGDGTTALQVIGSDGLLLCKATVCLIQYGKSPAAGNVFIKDYAENEGVLKALQDAGVVGGEVRRVSCGFTEAVEVPLLLVEVPAAWRN